MSRKTFNVEDFKAGINKQLASDFMDGRANAVDGIREGLCIALENVLHSTGNYKGFHYVDGWQHTRKPAGTEHKRFYF